LGIACHPWPPTSGIAFYLRIRIAWPENLLFAVDSGVIAPVPGDKVVYAPPFDGLIRVDLGRTHADWMHYLSSNTYEVHRRTEAGRRDFILRKIRTRGYLSEHPGKSGECPH
jgi:hypothetical protein